jgi:hypothetical protein
MKNVKTASEAYKVFDLLGIKDVTKPWQKRKGTEVWELPFKTMYYNGSGETNRFSIYRSGYVRKMVVHPTTGASYSCYQLNKVRKKPYFVKDYEWNGNYGRTKWTGKYRKEQGNYRVLIGSHADRVVYLCNYILKNYYRNSKCGLVGEYTMKRVAEVHGEWWRQNTDYLESKQDKFFHSAGTYDVQVIINGHRYNLS